MEIITIPGGRLILFFAITSLLTFLPVSTFGQGNTTNSSSVTSTSPVLPLRGVYQLVYSESGGLRPVHQFYFYDILGNHLTFVDLDNKTIKSKEVNSSAVDELYSIFYKVDIPSNLTHLKSITCPDCKQYGLSYYIVDPEKFVHTSGNAFWDDTTNGTEGLHNLTSLLVKLSR